MTVWKNGDNNKKVTELEERSVEQHKQSGKKDWGKKGPTCGIITKGLSFARVFRVLGKGEGLLPKKKKKI